VTLWRQSLGWLRPYSRSALLVAGAIVVEVAYWTLVPLGLRRLIDDAIPRRDGALLGGTLAVLALGFVFMALVSIGRTALLARVGARLLADRRLHLFEHLQGLPPRFFAATRTSDLAGRFLTELNTIETALTIGLTEITWGSLMIAVNVPLLYLLNVPLAIVATLAVPLALIGPRILAPRVSATAYFRRQAEGQLLVSVQEQLAGRAVVHAFGLELLMRDRLRNQLDRLRTLTARDGFQSRLVARSTTLSSALGQLLVFATGSVLVFRGDLSMGTFVGFIGLLLNVGEGIRWLAFGLPAWLQAAGPMQRLDEVLDEPSEVADADDALAPTRVLRGDIEVRQVHFAYRPGERPSASGISLTVAAGARVAIVGPSGSGKSTLLNLLMRAVDPDAGAILLGGTDLRRVKRDTLRRHIGVVFQDTFLFAGSVRDNIRLGRPDATDAEVEAAARAAVIHDAIEQLREGYDTDVGEHGEALSGGQRQRVALARAILRDPVVLLLDEATSALDPNTEAEFNATLRHVAERRTIVSVTHRLAGVVDADRIFVLVEGHLVEEGTHLELLQRNEVYGRLWAAQAGISVADDGLRAEVSATRLRMLPLLAGVDEAFLGRLANQFAPERVPAGRVVVTHGDPGDRFYLLARGLAEVVEARDDGSEHLLAVLGDGDHFGEIALLTDEPRTATVRTRSQCLLLSLAREHFDRLLAEAPGVREKIQQTAAARLGYTGATTSAASGQVRSMSRVRV
jgi:ATP-binding cassette, subfamily B, bacterial